jgi:disulfide oxidoreductase YuzD|tara:strand:- start:432 stop:1088 length:657 start_codon:yes stop_codon:yes gene_type:complete
MLFENSQDNWEIDLPSSITNIGLKISGGADSAIVCFMLAKYIMEERPDITLHPVTGIADNKLYQQKYADSVLRKVEELTGIVFGKHQYKDVTASRYILDQEDFLKSLYEQELFSLHFAGITANPSEDDAPQLYTSIKAMPTDDRSKQLIKKDNYRLPLINIDKRGVAEHYTRLGVMDTLFPVTRSCEAIVTDSVYNIDKHCEVCWFCKERYWGFNRYV